MKERNHSKFQEVNEYGEIQISPKTIERKRPHSLESRFLKIMTVLLLLNVFL